MTLASLRYLFGNITYAGAQFVIVILLNKFGSSEIVGQYSLGLAVTAPIFMLSHLHLRSVLIVDTSGKYLLEIFWPSSRDNRSCIHGYSRLLHP